MGNAMHMEPGALKLEWKTKQVNPRSALMQLLGLLRFQCFFNYFFDEFGNCLAWCFGIAFYSFILLHFFVLPNQINAPNLSHGDVCIIFRVCPVARKANFFLLKGLPIFAMFAWPWLCTICRTGEQHEIIWIQGLHSKIWYCQIHGHYAVYKKCRVFPTESPPSPLRSSPNRISDSLERSKALLDGFPI